MKKFLVSLALLALSLAAACTAPPTATEPTGIPATAAPAETLPDPTQAADLTQTPEPTPAAGPTGTAAPEGGELPGRFQACTEMENPEPRPLRWVYLDGGDLWVWEAGGEPISLTGTGDVVDLRLSPPDDRIVYIRAEESHFSMWAAGPDGADHVEITPDLRLPGKLVLHGFSTDGEKVAFTHLVTDRTGELWSADLDGSGARLLADQELLMEIVLEPLADGAMPAGVTWLPGTYVLAFDAAPTFNEDGIYIYVQEQVWYADAAGGSVAERFPAGEGGSVSFSPDGTTMLVASPDSLRAMNIEAGDLHPVAVPYAQIGFGEYYAAPALAWTPDSATILVALLADPADPYAGDAAITVWAAPADGAPAEQGLLAEGFFPSFVFSQDGGKIAFWRDGPQGLNQRELHLAESDGGEHIVYDRGGILDFLGWSPFDRYFVYGRFDAGEAFVGDLCADPVPLGLFPIGLRWLDAGTFVFEIHDEAGGRLEVYQGAPDGTVTLRLNLELGSRYEVEVQE